MACTGPSLTHCGHAPTLVGSSAALARGARRHRVRRSEPRIRRGRGAYTRSYGSDELDAAVLVLPLLGAEPPGSPRVTNTVDAIGRELDAGGPLLYRYLPGRDGLPGAEGSFLPCTFWMVQALAATGRVAEATTRFEALLQRSRPRWGSMARRWTRSAMSISETFLKHSPTPPSFRRRCPFAMPKRHGTRAGQMPRRAPVRSRSNSSR